MISSSNFFKKTFFGIQDDQPGKDDPLSRWNQKRYSTIQPPKRKYSRNESPQMTMSIEHIRRFKAKKAAQNMKLPVIEPSRMLRFIPTRNQSQPQGLLINRRGKHTDERREGRGSFDLRKLGQSLQLNIDSQRKHSKNMIRIVGSPTRRLAY